MSEGRKDEDGKLRWDLLPLHLIEKVVEVYTFGAQKYAPNSWQKLEDGYNRYKAALFRHLTAHEKGETVDPESHLPHLAHCAWNTIAMMHFAMKDKKITFDIKCEDKANPLLDELQQYAVNVSLSHGDECGERGVNGLLNIGQKVRFEFNNIDGVYSGMGTIASYLLNERGEQFLVDEVDENAVVISYNLKREDIKEIL